MRRSSGWLVVLGLAAALSACDFDGDLKRWRPPDSGADAGVDSGTPDAGPVDAGPSDAGRDAGEDGGSDAGADGGQDSGWVFAPDGSVNYAFVSSVTVSPSSLTPAEADAICGACARDAGLPGLYRAWLGLTYDNTYDRIGMAQARGWMRTDQLPFADRVDDLVAGYNLYPLNVDEHGTSVGDAIMASGAHPGGGASEKNCEDWSTPDASFFAGCASCGGSEWTEADVYPCTTPAHLYCFGLDQNAPLKVTAAAGRRVFISSDWVPDGGRTGADEHCNFDAWRLDAGPGNYVALVATSTESAASRLVSDAGWVRRDGVWVGDLRGHLFAPLLFQFDGRPGSSASTGAYGVGQLSGSASDNCRDWVIFGGAGYAVSADPLRTAPEWFGIGPRQDCGNSDLICVEP